VELKENASLRANLEEMDMTRKQMVVDMVLFFASAVVYGEIEATHVQFGPATLFHTFILNYHVPMGFLMLIYAYALKAWIHVPLWILLEDISFWVFSGRELASSSWVSMGLGGVSTPLGYLPTTYALLFVLWLGICAYKSRTTGV
jgi:hypothetical protein